MSETKKPAAKKATVKKATVPASAKKPADRKPKAEDGPEILESVVDGVTYKVEAAAMDDFELLDDLARIDDGDPARTAAVLRRLLGRTAMGEAMDRLRDKDTGRVTVMAGVEFVHALLNGLSPNS